MPIPPGEVRPTSERARQAYFNIVGGALAGAHFLDLFAGSGIFSFEALSRGAASAVAVDSARQNVALIRKTAGELGIVVETVLADVAPASKARAGDPPLSRLPAGRSWDLVYADPPYDFGRHDELLLALDSLPLSAGATVAVEHRRRTSPFTVELQRLSHWRRAEYGEVWITFFTASGLQ